ncbi:hypothetical protein ACCO45_008416 [Purpureocillium lilacinum]|uniref:Uncharacterized protein n=1 Tax=Purpureocillium lilacinum TaxID=33203 RepID=A0ACC4DNY9_PURLI
MAFGTLFTYADNPRSTAIKAIVEADTTKPSIEHLKAHGLGKIPAFLGEDGYALSECIAIAIYVTSQNEKTTLLGKTKQDYASILKWMSFFNSEFVPNFGNWFQPLVGKIPYNKKTVDDASKAVAKATTVVEKYLTRHTYLVGERITLADLFCASLLHRGFQYFFDKEWRSQNPATTRWYETVVNQPIITDKPEQPKAAPKPAAAPAAAAEEEPAAPKAKHPCEALPKASFPLDEWKRHFSNNETDEALKWFWANVPLEEEYSIWRCDYKYNDELTLTFMSNNLIGGFNTRLEASRKYIFGSASVYGESNDSVIQGAFVIRGQDHVGVFDVAPDWESYEFKKLDPKNAEDRAFLENMWSWEKGVVVNGKEYAHACGKVFK